MSKERERRAGKVQTDGKERHKGREEIRNLIHAEHDTKGEIWVEVGLKEISN